MHPPGYRLPLVFSFVLLVSTSSHAAERVSLQKITPKALQAMVHVLVPGAPKTANIPINTLQWISQHTDKHKMTHIRMQQHYAGFPVFGGYGILHQPNNPSAASMNGAIYRGLQAELGLPKSTLTQNAGLALSQFMSHYPKQAISDEHITPIVYVDEQQHAFWAYKVSILVRIADKIPQRPTAIIDAETYVPFITWNTIKTARSIVHGLGYGGNKRVGEQQYGKDYPLLEITRDDYAGLCYMQNAHVTVVDMEYQYNKMNTPMTFHCAMDQNIGDNTYWTGYQGDGYDQKNEGYSPSNDALYIGNLIKKMYGDWFDLDVLTQKNKPMPLVMRVHYGKNYENAFWDGEQMTFGDGDSMMYPLVSLTVGAHEISHGFTEQHADLNYFGQSGGMNESFSDMAAQAAEYYANGTNSWQIGADIFKLDQPLTALRFMDRPSRDGRSIDSADKYRRGMDVHYASGVYNRLFYLLANQPGWDPRQAFNVMVKANMDYWTPDSNFETGSCGVIRAAEDLELPIEDVKQALNMVAIKYQHCD